MKLFNQLTPEQEEIFRQWARDNYKPFTDISELATGMLVEVQSGPLQGIRGTITRIQGTHKLILSVEGLGRAALSVDASIVKPITQPQP